MSTNTINIRCFDSPREAPNYQAPEFNGAEITTAVVVGRGTTNGNPTIDLQFRDQNGNQYVAMVTATLLESVVAAAHGVKARTSGH